MIARVAETISRYSMFAPGQRVGVALSGGADSVCLLEVLRELAARLSIELRVLHLNHKLRGEESERDAEFAAGLASGLGLPFHLEECRVAESGGNLEQAARRARLEFFHGLIREGVVDRVATGHTQSDQAETVLFRVLRGTGTAGLAGIRPVTREGLVRPLIELRRVEVRDFLRERGVAWREDSSNRDHRFARNRLRLDVMPRLALENPRLEEVLAGMARVARDEEDYWARHVQATLRGHPEDFRPLGAGEALPHGRASVSAGGLSPRRDREGALPHVEIRADWLAGLDPALARRVLRKGLEIVRGDLRAVSARHVEEILALAQKPGRTSIPGVEAIRSMDWLWLGAPGAEKGPGYRRRLEIPGEIRLPVLGGARILLHLQTFNPRYNKEYRHEGEQLDWDKVSTELRLRNWQPGDRYQPVGLSAAVKIKNLFQEARIPVWYRSHWPVITCEDRIAWAARFGAAAEFAPGPASRTALKIEEDVVFLDSWSRSGRQMRP